MESPEGPYDGRSDFEQLDVDSLQTFLKARGIGEDALKCLREEQVDGQVLASCSNLHELKAIVPNLKNGPAQKILIELEKLPARVAPPSQTHSSKFPAEARRFGQSARGIKYLAGTTLVDEFENVLVESGPDNPNLLDPIREFKEFQVINRANVKSFFYQALRFIFGSINSRANGTIYFGVADKSVHVYGCELEAISREELTDELKQAVSNVLQHQERSTIVQHCLHNPKFIPVKNFRKKTLVVIEIDVESKYEFVQQHYFEIDLKKFVSGARGPQLFVREGTASKALSGPKKADFVKTVPELARRRRLAEPGHTAYDRKSAALESMMKSGRDDPFDANQFLVLILDNVSGQSPLAISSRHELNFIGKYCKWRVVVDLNGDRALHDEYAKHHQTISMTIDSFRDGSRQLESKTDSTWWLFANGQEEANIPAQTLPDWKGAREEAVVGLISQLRYMSSSNCLAVFIFIDDNDGIMAAIYSRFYESGFCNPVFIAQYERALENLRDTVAEDKIELCVNGMVGLPWKHVESILRAASGQLDPECEIATSSGALVKVERDKWTDIEILGAKECSGVELGSPTRLDYFVKERQRFYSGNPVSWLNCALSPDGRGPERHIIKRSEHEKLRRTVESTKYNGRSYEALHVYHHPGAGGSTLARHVLWELKGHYKCGVIKLISSRTTKRQIEEMYRYGDEKVPTCSLKPVILVLDHPNQAGCDIFLNELNQNQDADELICVIINCRRTNEENSRSKVLSRVFHHGTDIFLSQKFTTDEENYQFQAVMDVLTDPRRQNLKMEADLMLGFMALISPNVEAYVTATIKRYVDTIEDWERELLTYIALMNTYNSDDPDIPTAFFDFLIPEKLRNSLSAWASLNRPCAIFCTIGQKVQIGTVSCIRIKLHPIFARELLRLLKPGKLSELVLQFLNCKGFTSSSFSREEVIKMATSMIRKRRYDSAVLRSFSDRDKTESKYSDLINDILSEEKRVGSEELTSHYTGAVNVVKRALDVLQYRNWKPDPYLAQLIARVLYIEARNYNEALHYAEMATKLQPNQSYLLDTMGQIYRDNLNKQFDSFVGLPLSQYNQAIDLSKNALSWFKKAIEVSESTKEINYSPHMGLVEVYKNLFSKMLPCCADILGRKILFDYLSEQESIPAEVTREWSSHHQFMKALSTSCMVFLKATLDKLTMIKPVQSSQSTLESQTRKLVENVMECYLAYQSFWPVDYVPDYVRLNPMQERAYKSRKVEQIGGLSFFTIMELGQKEGGHEDLRQMQYLLEENTRSEPYSVKDAERLLYVYLSLSTRLDIATEGPFAFQIYGACVKFGTLAERPRHKGVYNLVMSMLLWPQEEMFGIPYNDKVFRSILHDMKSGNEFLRKDNESDLEYYQRTGKKRTNYKARTEFYLRKTETNQKVIYRGYVNPTGAGGKSLYSDDQFWAAPNLEELLARITGVIRGRDLMAQNALTRKYDIPIRIAHKNSALAHVDDAIVEFYLGFSWDGPVAYGVEPVRHREFRNPTTEVNPLPSETRALTLQLRSMLNL